MIEARGVAIRRGQSPPLLSAVDLTFAPGERIGLLGRSGSGKSSLLLALAGLIAPAAGTILVDGVPAHARGARRLVASRVGLLFQSVETQLLTGRVADEIALTLEQLGWPPARIRDQVARVAHELDLGPLLARAPQALSGGEMQRVALAAAVVAAPTYLLLDEPTAHLDAEATVEIESWIEQTATRTGALALTAAPWARPLLPPHRVPGQRPGAGRNIVLAGRRVAHDGPGPPPAALEAHLTGEDESMEARSGDSSRPPLTPNLPAELTPLDTGFVLRARSVAAGWNGRAVVRDVDLEIRAGEILSLIGRNGSGKSTLLLALAGLMPLLGGSVEIEPPGPLRARVSCVLQFAERLFYRASAGEELADWAADPEAARAALAVVGLDAAILAASPFQLSGGEARRLALAAGVASRRPLLLLDEPGAGLDGPGQRALVRLVRAFAQAGGSVIIASHDPALIALGDHRLALARGMRAGATSG